MPYFNNRICWTIFLLKILPWCPFTVSFHMAKERRKVLQMLWMCFKKIRFSIESISNPLDDFPILIRLREMVVSLIGPSWSIFGGILFILFWLVYSLSFIWQILSKYWMPWAALLSIVLFWRLTITLCADQIFLCTTKCP